MQENYKYCIGDSKKNEVISKATKYFFFNSLILWLLIGPLMLLFSCKTNLAVADYESVRLSSWLAEQIV